MQGARSMRVATMANKETLFVTFMDRNKRFEAHSSQFFLLIPTDWLHLRVAQNPRSQDLVIFVVTTTDRQTDRQTDKLITLPLCMHVGNNDYVLLNCMGLSATSRLLAP